MEKIDHVMLVFMSLLIAYLMYSYVEIKEQIEEITDIQDQYQLCN